MATKNMVEEESDGLLEMVRVSKSRMTNGSPILIHTKP